MPKWTWVILPIIVFVVAVIAWLRPASDSSTQAESKPSVQDKLVHVQTDSQTQTSNSQSVSQQDTQINCQLRLDAAQHLIVNEQTKQCFEYFISQYGEKQLARIEQDFSAYIQAAYPSPGREQILDLWQRYLKYRNQLAHLNKPVGEENAAYFAKIFNDTQQLRERFFNALEVTGLFGSEDIYHNYSLSRLKVLEDKTLSEQDKARQLSQLFQDLPQDWQDNLKTLSQLEDLRRLSSDLKARGGSAAELKQLRLNLVGAEATTRLEQLDQERQAWKNDVNHYLAARDQILQSASSDQVKQQNIHQLKQQYFPQTQQQLRIETFETIHDQGGHLPFAD